MKFIYSGVKFPENANTAKTTAEKVLIQQNSKI